MCLRAFVLAYSNYKAVTESPPLTYSCLNNVQFSALTGYPKSLWQTLGKAAIILCALDLPFVQAEVEKVKEGTKFTLPKRSDVKKACRLKLKTVKTQSKNRKVISELTVMFPNLFNSL